MLPNIVILHFNDTYTTTQTEFGNTGIGPLNKTQNSECCRVMADVQFRIVKILQCHFLFRSHGLPLNPDHELWHSTDQLS